MISSFPTGLFLRIKLKYHWLHHFLLEKYEEHVKAINHELRSAQRFVKFFSVINNSMINHNIV